MLEYLRAGRRGSLLLPVYLCLALVAGSCKKATNPPAGTLSGDITLAPGQTGDLSVVAVQVYLGDPFASGATPSQVVVATGTPALAHYSVEIAHGDFYVVAWKDANLNGLVDSGDLYGWYDGAVNGSGQPVAAPLHILHGQSGVENVAVSVKP